jgi:HD-GYP domain-containing protein (c-di-GMP phosphodiesterase class II)
MAEYMDQPQHFVDKIRLFAPLHDIGKVGIPDAILLAPRKLDPAEWATMQSHAEIGWRILADRPTLEMAADIARYHHEHWDGNGYPHSLAGEEIPLCARIVAIADVYDALRSSRPYKEPWSHEGAAAIIREGAGTHFDPALVEAFEALGAEFQEIFNQFPSEE